MRLEIRPCQIKRAFFADAQSVECVQVAGEVFWRVYKKRPKTHFYAKKAY